MTLAANMVVADRFRLVRELGHGGMGSVWLADHIGLETACAVKFIHPDVAEVAQVRMRFEREAKAVAQLRSPHVVQVLDYGESEHGPYIAMEYLEGEDLATRLARRGERLDPAETVAILSQVARGLGKAHAAGLVHRDLKPENIFLVRDDEGDLVKVLDFGVAKNRLGPALDGPTATGVLLGTPSFMSPEQAQGIRAVDHRTDLWAMAMVAFRCLTGRMPFVGEALGELLVQIIVGEIPSPSRIAPELPPSVDVWFARAVERDPDRRFQSARELVDALAAALGLDARGASVRPRASSAGESIDLVNVGDDDAARRTGMLAASTPGIARTYIGLGPWVERPRPLRFAIAAVVAASTIGAVVATLVWHRATSGGDPGQPPIASASGGATASGSAGSTTPGAAPTASAEPIGSAGDACERAGCVEPAGEAPRPPSGGGASAKAPSTAKPSPNRGARKVTKRYNPGF